MHWHHICIPLSYKYDVAIIFDDIIYMVEQLLDNPSGELTIAWPSNAFRTEWRICWTDDRVVVASSWEQIPGKGVAASLNLAGELKLSKCQFLGEWAELVRKINEVLVNAVGEFPGMQSILRLTKQIQCSGTLYR